MLDNINEVDEVECEVLINKYVSLDYSEKKIKERLRFIDLKLFLVFNSPLKMR